VVECDAVELVESEFVARELDAHAG
jgi:hypothetical protein